MPRFKFPDLEINKSINSMLRKVKKTNLFDYFAKNGLFAFNIFNKEFNVIAIISSDLEDLSIFKTTDELFTCHNSFNGDEKAINYYGYNCTCVEFREENNINPNFLLELKKHKNYVKVSNSLGYLLKISKGQNDFFVDEDEAILIYDVLQYLFIIRKIYESKEEEIPEKGEYITSFYFNDDDLMYDCRYISIDSFNFLPNLKPHRKASKMFVDKLSNLSITPGVLYIGNIILRGDFDRFRYSNGFNVSLRPIFAYVATDTGILEYEIYSAREHDFDNKAREVLDNLIMKIGLFDLVITDNILLYFSYKKDFEALGIEIKLDLTNYVNEFIYASTNIDQLFLNSDMLSIATEYFNNLKDEYADEYESIINGSLFVENDDLDDEDIDDEPYNNTFIS